MPEPLEIDDELTAYLDGELDAAAAARIEERLASDESYRRRLSQLDRAWSMLDRLEPAAVDETFTRTTLEMVALAAAEEVETLHVAAPRRSRSLWLFAGTTLIVAMLGGYFGMRALLPSPNSVLLADLPILERLAAFQRADSLEFLRALEAKQLFLEPADTATLPEKSSSVSTAVNWADESNEQRRARVAAMDPLAKEQLRHSQKAFLELGAAKRDRLRQLYAQLLLPENASLRPVMERLSQWFDTLSFDQQDDLLSLPLVERVAKIQRLKPPLSGDDYLKIAKWIEDFAWSKKDDLVKSMGDEGAKRFEDNSPEEQKRWLVGMIMRRWHGGSRSQQGVIEQAEIVESFKAKVGDLTEAARATFEAAPPAMQEQLVREWTPLALRKQFELFIAKHGFETEMDERLEHFKRQLSAQEWERLRGLPLERRQRELRWLFDSRFDRPPSGEGRGRGRGGRGFGPREDFRPPSGKSFGEERAERRPGDAPPDDGPPGDRPPRRDRRGGERRTDEGPSKKPSEAKQPSSDVKEPG